MVALVAAAVALPLAVAKPAPLAVQVLSGPSQRTTATSAQFSLSVAGGPTAVTCKQELGVGDTFAGSGPLTAAPAGGAWQVDRGTLTAFGVAGGVGRVNVGANQTQLAFVPLATDFDVSARMGFETGVAANTKAVLEGRALPGSSRYLAGLLLTAKNAVQLQVERSATAGTTVIGTPVTVIGKYQAGSQFYVRFQGVGSTMRAKAWAVGAIEPGWQITATDTALSTGTGVGFGAAATGGGGRILADDFVAINPAAASSFSNCAAGTAGYTGLGIGGHVFTARVGTNNEARLAIYPWTINPSAPTASLSAQPSNPTTDTTATFAWTTTGVVDTTTCTLDGATAPCSSPRAYPGLGIGPHTFAVTVANVSGSDTKTVTWTINPSAPTLSISAKPTNPTTDSDATFGWTTTGVVDATLCELDGATAPCVSPRSYSGLSLGTHSFTVTVSNVSGSDTATVTWTINPSPPEVFFFPSGLGDPDADATFAWQTVGIVETTTCSLDGVAVSPCTSPKSFFGLGPGSAHQFTVTVTNVSGSNSASRLFFVDQVAPTVAITGHPTDPTTETSASFAWTITGLVEQTTCSLDNQQIGCLGQQYAATGLAPGSHSFTVTVSNATGSSSDTFAWTINRPVVNVPLVPLAVPDTNVGRAELRIYSYCSSAGPTLLTTTHLERLPDEYQTTPGMTLWGVLSGGPGGSPAGTALTVPAVEATCNLGYAPIGVEVRVAAAGAGDGVDLSSSTCAVLAATRYADCWSRLSEFRSYRTGNPNAQPQVGAVSMSGGTCSPDPLFSRVTSCTANVAVELDWGDRDVGPLNVPANFQVSINGQPLTPPGGPMTGVWTSATPINVGAQTGANQLVLQYQWRDNNPAHTWRGQACRVANNTPCQASASTAVHRSFAGDDATAGLVDLVRISATPQLAGGPIGEPIMALNAEQATTIFVYPTVGLRKTPPPHALAVLPASSAQGTQSLACDPNYSAGAAFQVFVNGCGPVYGANDFTDPTWWNTAMGQCPSVGLINSLPNSPTDPWRCVVVAPGFTPSVLADGIAARTGNCVQSASNSCQRVECVNPSAYPNFTSSDPRLVQVFVVPYGAMKNASGSTDTVPVARTAQFYVTGWRGGSALDTDPCPGADAAPTGAVVGHVVQP